MVKHAKFKRFINWKRMRPFEQVPLLDTSRRDHHQILIGTATVFDGWLEGRGRIEACGYWKDMLEGIRVTGSDEGEQGIRNPM